MCKSHPYSAQSSESGFRIHFIKYSSTILGLWLIWALTGQGHPWPIYPTLGWGISVLSHYLAAGRPTLRLRRSRPASATATAQAYREWWDGHAVEVQETQAEEK